MTESLVRALVCNLILNAWFYFVLPILELEAKCLTK